MKKTVTTITVDEDMFIRFKIECLKKKLKYSTMVEKLMEKYLEENEEK